MLRSRFDQQLRSGILAALAIICSPLVASAGTINIILSDMDVNYLGSAAGGTGALFDAMGGYAGGNLNKSEADRIKTAVFESGGNIVGTLMDEVVGDADNLYGDLKIDGVGASIPLNSFLPNAGNNGTNFGFDFFNENAGNSLQLNIDEVSLLLSNGVFFFTGQATVKAQNLPFGLQFDTTQPIYISYTATLPGVSLSSPTSMGIGSGAFTISGTMVIPEVATSVLFIIGAFGLVGMRHGCSRHRRARFQLGNT